MSAPPTTLRAITRAGQWLLTGTIVAFAILGVLWPQPYSRVWQLVLSHLVFGRAGNVLVGLELQFPAWFIFLQCCVEDIIILLLFYPLLVAGYRRAVEWRILGPTLVNIRSAADRHKSKIEPFGIAGLMIFVIFPFWSTGALVGALVGYLIGMRTWVTFATVLTGNAVAVALWVWFFDQLRNLSTHLTRGLLIAIIVAVVAGAVFAQIRRLARQRRWFSYAQYLEKPAPENGKERVTAGAKDE
jgi:uncharacterized membrane protein